MTPFAQMLARYWQLDAPQAKIWWRALGRARWSVAQAWRQQVLLFDQALVRPRALPQAIDAAQRFLATSCTPPQVLAVLDALVGERLLRRQDARQIEAKVLAMVDKDGVWK